MPRRIRVFDPQVIYHVSNRTQEAKFLFVPDEEFNAIVIRWLRRAVRAHGVLMYAAVIMGNHFHLIVSAPRNNLSEFMRYFQTNLSREVNVLRNRFDASTFPRRFKAEPIVDEDALKKMLSYVVLNPVAANLVEFPVEYPGYTSWHQHVGEPERGKYDQELPPITPPPMWAELSPEELAEAWRELVRPTIAHHAKIRTRPVKGAKKVRQMDWWRRPRRPKRSPRIPLCHATDLADWKRYADFVNRTQTRYRKAVLAWRRGVVEEFPFGTIPPGWAECVADGSRRLPEEFRLAKPSRSAAA